MRRAGGIGTASLAIALAALALLLALGFSGAIDERAALISYLAAYVFLLEIALGSLALLMIHALTGGAWGFGIRVPLRAALRLLPLLALLWIPILIGLHALYPWAQSAPAIDDPNLERQRWYLDVPFFIVRACVCFAIWIVLAWRVDRALAGGAREGGEASVPAGLAGGGLVAFALTTIVAGTDWIMSLVPGWRSSAFGLLFATASMLSAAAFAILAAPGARERSAKLRGDLGNLLMTLVLAWAYQGFMSYLTAWIADLPSETVWYLPRTTTSWGVFGVSMFVAGFVVPFAIMLSRRAKRSAAGLASSAALALAAQVAFALWLVAPSFRADGFQLRWTDPLALAAIAGLGALVAWRASRRIAETFA